MVANSIKIGISGLVPMVATTGENITAIHSTLTIVTLHVPHS